MTTAVGGRGRAYPDLVNAHVLVVEDDATVRDVVARYLGDAGHRVELAGDGPSGLEAAVRGEPDVVVLDLMLPGLSGLEVCRALRARRTNAAIVMLTALGEEDDRVLGLELGADDYVTKPFGMAELLARLRAAVRRAAAATVDGEPVVDAGDFRVDLAAKKVVRGGAEVHLTPTEWGILELLVRHRGKLVGQRELLRAVWGPGYGTETNYLRVYLAQLRRKLEPEPSRPRHLITEAGMGYRFEV